MIRKQYNMLLTLTALIAAYSIAATAADTITGTVHNRTLGELAAGDEVLLLRMDSRAPNPAHVNQSIQEEGRTRTDSQGSFTLKAQNPDATHLLRVVHQGVNYDHPILAGGDNSVDVFDATTNVEDITGTVEIIRIGSNGELLHVSDMIEIKNNSSPPLTKSGHRTFEIYLPELATIDSVLAASSAAGTGPEATALTISAAPVPGEPGHYAVNFPLRPGATKFAFNYDVPYRGHVTFHPRSMYRLQQLAVMIPPSMKFATQSTDFVVLNTGNDHYQVEAANLLKPGLGPQFEISGAGASAPKAQGRFPPKALLGAQSFPADSARANGATQRPNDLCGANSADSTAKGRMPQKRKPQKRAKAVQK